MNEPHLDDEELSAALDHVGDGAAQAHLETCAACRTRFDGLHAVRQAIAGPGDALRADVADRAIGAALAAWSAERAGAGAAVADGGGALTATGGDGPGRTEPQPAPEAVVVVLRRRAPAWVAAMAALVAAVLLAVPILSATSGRDGAEQTAAGPSVEDGAKAGEADLAALDGGDLGAQSDQLALGRILETSVSAPRGAEAASPAAGSPAPPAATAAVDEAAGDATSPGLAPAPAARGTVPVAGGRSSTFQSSAPPPCSTVVRGSLGRGLGPLVYRASLEWQGAPAVLLAYRLADTSGTGPDHRAFVMALDDCRPLVVQGF